MGNKHKGLGSSVWETGRPAWLEHSEKKTKDMKNKTGKAGSGQITKGFIRNTKDF